MYRKSARLYRQTESSHVDEQKFQVVVEETDLWITIPKDCNREMATLEVLNIVNHLRNVLKLVIMSDPNFETSLTPLPVNLDAPVIAKKMAKTAEKMGVGPFAAVAGAIAQEVAGHLVLWLQQYRLPGQVIVENGGDLYIYSNRERIVGLLADPESGSQLGVLVHDDEFPVAMCASSAKIGHSLSFGQGDLAVVRSKSAYLADAAATAYCNMLKDASSIPQVLKRAEADARYGVDGVLLQCDGQVGVWGKMELVPVSLSGAESRPQPEE